MAELQPSDSALQLEALATMPPKEYEPMLFIVEATREFCTAGGREALLDAAASGTKRRFSLVTPESLLNYAASYVSDAAGADDLESAAPPAPAFSVPPALAPPQLPAELAALHARLTEQQQQQTAPAQGQAAAMSSVSPAVAALLGQQSMQQGGPLVGDDGCPVPPPDSPAAQIAAAVRSTPPELWAKMLAAKIDADRVTWAVARHQAWEEEQRLEAIARQNARKKKPAPAKKPLTATATATSLSVSVAPDGTGDGASDAGAPAGAAQAGAAGQQGGQGGAEKRAAAGGTQASQGPGAAAAMAQKGAGAKKGKKPVDVADDAPADGPDMYYLLSGFPCTAASVPVLKECGVPLSSVVTVSISPEIKRAAAELLLGRGGTRGKPGTSMNIKARKTMAKARGGAPAATPMPEERPTTESQAVHVEQSTIGTMGADKAAADALSFSPFCMELRAMNDAHLLWLEVREGDPADGNATLQRIANKLYEVSSLRKRYSEWLKTCNVVSLHTPPQQSGATQDESNQRYARSAARIPEQAAGPLVVLDGILEQATGSPSAADAEPDDDTEAALTRFLDRSLQHLAGERPSTSVDEDQKPPEPILLNHADVLGQCLVGSLPKVGQRLRAIEQQHLSFRKIPGKDRHMMPEVPEMDPLERETERCELVDFMHDLLPDPLSASELDRILTLLSFEDMMAEMDQSGQWPFDDRVFIERISAKLFPRVFADAMVSRPVQYTRYDPETDSVLVCLDTGASDHREKTSTWQSQISAKTSFKQWLDTQAPGTCVAPNDPLLPNSAMASVPLLVPKPDATQSILSMAPQASQAPQAAPSAQAQAQAQQAQGAQAQGQAQAAPAAEQTRAQIYDIEEQKAKIVRKSSDLFPPDGCIIRSNTIVTHSHSSTNVTVLFPEGELVALSTSQPDKKALARTGTAGAPPVIVTASGQFVDGSRFAIRNDPLSMETTTTTLSYTQPSGLIVILNLDGRVDLIPPRANRPVCCGACATEDSWQPGVLFPPAHPPGDLHGDVEVSRSVMIDSNGSISVARHFASGSVAVLYSNGDVETFDVRTRTTRTVSDSGQRVSVNRSFSNTTSSMASLLPMLQAATGGNEVTNLPVGIARVTDPETRQVVTTREDMTMTVRSPTGESYSRFADGTLLRNLADGTAQVCSPGSVDVRVSRNGESVEIHFGDGTIARCVLRDGGSGAGASLHLNKAGSFSVSADSRQATLQPARIEVDPDHLPPIEVGIYRIDLQTGTLSTPDYEHRSYTVTADGAVHGQGDSASGQELPVSLTHPPRLFRIFEDGSAFEYLPQSATERFLARAHAAKDAYVIEQPADTGSSGSTSAANIACWTHRDLPRAFGDDAEDGLAPNIVAVADPCALEAALFPHSEARPTPVVAVVREIVRHRRLPEDQMARVLDALDEFDKRQTRTEPTSLESPRPNDPRTPQERYAQAALLKRLEEMLRSEAAAAAAIAASKSLTVDSLDSHQRGAPPSRSQLRSRGVTPGAVARTDAAAAAANAAGPGATSSAPLSQAAPMPPVGPLDDEDLASSERGSSKASEALKQLQQQPLNYFNTEQAVNFLKSQTSAPRVSSAKRQRLQKRRAESQAVSQSQQSLVQQQQSRQVAPERASGLIVAPAALPFGTVLQTPGAVYTMPISVTNSSTEAMRFGVRQPKDTAAWHVVYTHGAVAPGMTVRAVVELRAGSAAPGKLSDEVTVLIGTAGETAKVALNATVVTQEEASKTMPADRVQQMLRRAKAASSGQQTLPPLLWIVIKHTFAHVTAFCMLSTPWHFIHDLHSDMFEVVSSLLKRPLHRLDRVDAVAGAALAVGVVDAPAGVGGDRVEQGEGPLLGRQRPNYSICSTSANDGFRMGVTLVSATPGSATHSTLITATLEGLERWCTLNTTVRFDGIQATYATATDLVETYRFFVGDTVHVRDRLLTSVVLLHTDILSVTLFLDAVSPSPVTIWDGTTALFGFATEPCPSLSPREACYRFTLVPGSFFPHKSLLISTRLRATVDQHPIRRADGPASHEATITTTLALAPAPTPAAGPASLCGPAAPALLAAALVFGALL
eukprot:m51a1_g7191 hypothetical protein (2062) ;mRNA; f:123384-148042